MSRGRKAKSTSSGLEVEQIFNKFQGFYFQYIITQLGSKNKRLSDQSANNLLEKITDEKEKLISEKFIKQGKIQKPENQEVLFQIPSNWTWCLLDDICIYITDGTHQTPNYKPNGRVFLSAQNIKPFRFLPEKHRFVSEEAYQDYIKSRKAEKGDLLIARVGAGIGETAVIDRAIDFAFYVSLGLAKPFKSYVKSEYLALILNSPFGVNYAKGNISSKGGSAGNFNLGRIRSFPIPLPPLSEQEMIVDFLQDFGKNALDENREYFDSEIENEVLSIHQAQIYNNQILTELNHQLALVKELRQAYLREAMQGNLVSQDSADEPAEILLEKIKAEKEKLVAEKRIRRDKPLPPINAEEIPFEIPSNWAWCRLGEISEMCLGKMLDQVKNKGGLQPYLRNVNVRWGSFDLSDLKEMRFTEDEEERYSAIYGDLIICEGGEPGRAAIWKDEKSIKIQKALHRVRTNKEALQSEYLYYCLLCDANSKRLSEYFTGGGIQHFTGKSLSKYAIPLPPLAEQERVVAKLEKLMKFCDELEANISQGITHADQLLQNGIKEALEPK